MNVIYSKLYNTILENKNDEYKYYNSTNKKYSLFFQTNNFEIIKDYFDIYIFSMDNEFNLITINSTWNYSLNDRLLIKEFISSDKFYIFIDNTKKYNVSESNILYIDFLYETSIIDNNNEIALKKIYFFKSNFSC